METKNIIIKWGLIGGAVSIISSLVSYLLGMSDNKLMQYVGLIMILAIIVMAMFEQRSKIGNGFACFSDLFKVGLLVGLIIAVFSAIWSIVYFNYIDTEFMGRLLLKTEIELENQGLSDKDIKNAMEMTKKFMTPVYMMIMGFASTLITSGFVSLVSALVIKNNKPEILE